jgi:TRAP-type C4-dicarboxylate transport system permease small subunit
MKKLIGFGDRLWKYTSIIAGFFVIVYMLLIIVNIIMRRLFNNPIFGVTELICYGSLAACCFGLAQTEWKNGNVTVTILVERTSLKVKHTILAISALFCCCGFCYVAFHCIRQIFVKLATGGGTTDLHIPLWIITIFLAIGFLLLAICTLMKFAISVSNLVEAFINPQGEENP